jgi:hypothetical protein
MLLKTYLKNLYGLSEEYVVSLVSFLNLNPCPSKCSRFTTGKKTVSGDKPAVKLHQEAISWVRLPFAIIPLMKANELEQQKNQVISWLFCILVIEHCGSFLLSGTRMEYLQNLEMNCETSLCLYLQF